MKYNTRKKLTDNLKKYDLLKGVEKIIEIINERYEQKMKTP